MSGPLAFTYLLTTDGSANRIDRLDPSVFMLSKNGHKMSSPTVFTPPRAGSIDHVNNEQRFPTQRLDVTTERLHGMGSINRYRSVLLYHIHNVYFKTMQCFRRAFGKTKGNLSQ